MTERIGWNSETDRLIAEMRQQGGTWATIGTALGVSRNAARERGRRLHVTALPPRPRVPEPLEPPDRDALPPGHPASWGALIRGTVLAGTPYPWPIPGVPPLPKGDQE